MLKNLFQNIQELNYIKVTKTNWARIEDLFATKDRTILEQRKTLAEQESLIQSLQEEIKPLRKFKANDDLLFSYEKSNAKHIEEKKKLMEQLDQLANAIDKADKKINSNSAIESLYLDKINELKYRPREVIYADYEEKGERLLEIYS